MKSYYGVSEQEKKGKEKKKGRKEKKSRKKTKRKFQGFL